MIYHFMKLNEDKMEFIILGKSSRVELCKEISLSFNNLDVSQTDLKKVLVKSLGVKIDHDLSMKHQSMDVKKTTFWTISNLRNFGHFLSEYLNFKDIPYEDIGSVKS